MLVSVIIPCYNVEHYIGECIDSALRQTHKPLEIICVDNNSTDETVKLLNDYAARYPDKIRVAVEKRQGASAARNLGIRLANGAWLQFLDADDLLLPEKISRQARMAEDAEHGVAFIAGASKKKYVSGKETITDNIERNPLLAAFMNKCGNTCANLWRKDSLIEAGCWNDTLKSSQETDLMFRLVLNGTSFLIDTIPDTIIRERENGQISQSDPSERLSRYVNVRLDYMKEVQKKFPSEYRNLSNLMYDFIVVSLIELARYNAQKANDIFLSRVKSNWKSAYAFGLNPVKYFLIKKLGLSFYAGLKR